jgi:type I restriction enzyme, S subunit
MSEWNAVPIGELCKYIVDCLHETPEIVDYETGYYMIRTSDVRNGFINLDTARNVTEEVYERRIQRGIPQEGDIVITREAPLGEVGRIPIDNAVCLGQRLIQYRPDPEKISPKYLLYALLSPFVRQEFGANKGVGSVVDNLRMGVARSLPIPILPREDQDFIAHILGSLDDKIEANRRQNETLEATARAIFKSWFVDFDPVHAKARGEHPPGMDAATAALFPDSFEASELGLIPSGWRVGTLGEIADVNARSIARDYPYDEIEYIDISSVTEGRLEGTTIYALDEAPSRARRIVVHADVIWSTVRPNRKSYLYIHTPPENMIASTGFVALSAFQVPSTYLYLWVTTDTFVEYLVNNASGSAYPAVNAKRFAEAEILIPPDDILHLFDEVIIPMRDQIAHNEREARTLAETRDALLPRLVSGELRVGN